MPPPSGISAIFTNFSCTYAAVVATRKSHAKAMSAPKPTAAPSRAAMVGFGQRTIARMTR